MKTLFDKTTAITKEHAEYTVLDRNDVAKTISDDFGMLPLYVEKGGVIYYSVICYSEQCQKFDISESIMSGLLDGMGKTVNYCGSIYVSNVYSYMDDENVRGMLGKAECILAQTHEADKVFSEVTNLNKYKFGTKFGHAMFQFELETKPQTFLDRKRALLKGTFVINEAVDSIVITDIDDFGEACPALTFDLIKQLKDSCDSSTVSIEYSSIGIMQAFALSMIKWQQVHKTFSTVEVITVDNYTKYLTITL